MDARTEQRAHRRTRRLGAAAIVGLLLILVAPPGPVTAAGPTAAGALQLTFSSRPDCDTKATDLTFTLTKAPGTEDLDITITKAVLTVGADNTENLAFTPVDLAPGITQSAATTQAPLGQAVQVQIEFTLTQDDGSTSDSATGLNADPAPGPVACPAQDVSTSTSAPTPTNPPPTVPVPSPPPGNPPPAEPVTGGANFTG